MPPRKSASTKDAAASAASGSTKKKAAASTKAKPAAAKAKASKRKRDDDEEEEKEEAAEEAAPASPSAAPASPAAAADPLTADPALMSLDALKTQLKSWGLQSSGVKGDLIKRFRAFQKTGKIPAKKKRNTDVFKSFGSGKGVDAKDPFVVANKRRNEFFRRMFD